MSITTEELANLLDKASPWPWNLCHHLQSKENDEGCSCGYRGVVFGPEIEGFAVCQPGHDPAPSGQEGTEPQRYPRAVELANAQLIARLPDLAAELLVLREKHERQQKMAWKLVEALRFVRGWRDAQDMSHADYRIEVGKRAEAVLSEWEARNG